jgi:catechol 2,3-dioxygenase-like lactoylglutathione lyase family enzyme
MTPLRLIRAALNVSALEPISRFYEDALGFHGGPVEEDQDLAGLLGVRRARTRRLRLGAQELELCETDPAGAAYPDGALASDLMFQHCALTTPDIAAAFERLKGFSPRMISSAPGPVRLPEASGGATALKFRDPDGHPLELIAFQRPCRPGIDHSALVTADAAKSRSFYETLGFSLAYRHQNHGAEQDALDGLQNTRVEIVGLEAPASALKVELLGYEHPRPGGLPASAPCALAATRLVFQAPEGSPPARAGLRRDPDGHWLCAPEPVSR